VALFCASFRVSKTAAYLNDPERSAVIAIARTALTNFILSINGSLHRSVVDITNNDICTSHVTDLGFSLMHILSPAPRC
jgi:hypothetical protein